MGQSSGASDSGDANAIYYKLLFKVDPRYQLIVVGTFPNSRYFSIVLYDEHKTLSGSLLDQNIAPLTSQYTNPYRPGNTFAAGQKFASVIGFGGSSGTFETGCKMDGYNVGENALDATRRHPGMNWNADPSVFQEYPNFTRHVVDAPDHSNPNTAGIVMIRSYLDITPSNYNNNPHIIVRDMASGCAYPADYAINTLQIVTSDINAGWLDQTQIQKHKTYDNQILPKLCFGGSNGSKLSWSRGTEYTPAADVDSSYIGVKNIPVGFPANLASAQRVLRIRLRIPTTPPTPCTNGCSRSGTEQLRYMSLSFEAPGGATLTSLADNAFVKDSNGYATVIAGTGAAVPSWVTAADGYTFVDLTAYPNYLQLVGIEIRDILAAGNFSCSGQIVPYGTGAETPSGALMGDYLPVIDFPIASTLSQTAVPIAGANACDVFPEGQPAVCPNCAVAPNPPIQISSAATYCPGPGCSQFTIQPRPPLVITGSGFGSLPQGLPFTGNSNYLEITDNTQGWSAGHTGDPCDVNIDRWDSTSVSMTVNVNTNGSCPLAAGDLITIMLWNPQSLAQASYTTTALNY